MTSARPERSISVEEGEGCLRGQFQAMASPCEVLCEIDDHSEARRLTSIAAAEAWRIEDKFSRYLPGNIIDRINDAAGKAVAAMLRGGWRVALPFQTATATSG